MCAGAGMLPILWGMPAGPPGDDVVLGGCVVSGSVPVLPGSPGASDLQIALLGKHQATHECSACGWRVARLLVEGDGWVSSERQLLDRLGLGPWEA